MTTIRKILCWWFWHYLIYIGTFLSVQRCSTRFNTVQRDIAVLRQRWMFALNRHVESCWIGCQNSTRFNIFGCVEFFALNRVESACWTFPKSSINRRKSAKIDDLSSILARWIFAFFCVFRNFQPTVTFKNVSVEYSTFLRWIFRQNSTSETIQRVESSQKTLNIQHVE